MREQAEEKSWEGCVNKNRGKQSVPAEYVCFVSHLDECVCCSGAPLGSFWTSLISPLH